MDTTLILIVLFVFILMVFLILFINNLNKDNFIASDGSRFTSQADLDLYQDLILKTKALFSEEEDNSTSQSILGYDRIFLTNLKTDGFRDLKTLIKYRDQFKALSVLINP